MTTIRGLYFNGADRDPVSPSFPASDQHPLAQRYRVNGTNVGDVFVDAIGGEPSVSEINAFLTPPPPPTPAEKLAASGLTVQDLRTLLGLP